MPSPNDPFGENDPPRPVDLFSDGLRGLIHEEVRIVLRGRTTQTLDGTPDAVLAMELIARGWVAYKPAAPLIKEAP